MVCVILFWIIFSTCELSCDFQTAVIMSKGVVSCSTKKKSWQKFEDNFTTQFFLFDDSDNLFHSDSGSSENYMEYAQKKKSNKWFCQKCSVSLHSGKQNTKYHAPKQYQNFYSAHCKTFKCLQ